MASCLSKIYYFSRFNFGHLLNKRSFWSRWHRNQLGSLTGWREVRRGHWEAHQDSFSPTDNTNCFSTTQDLDLVAVAAVAAVVIAVVVVIDVAGSDLIKLECQLRMTSATFCLSHYNYNSYKYDSYNCTCNSYNYNSYNYNRYNYNSFNCSSIQASYDNNS